MITNTSYLLAGALLIIGTVFLSNVQHLAPATDTNPAAFVQVRPGLYRLNFAWKLPGLAPFPVAVWLVESSPNSWILIDAGTPSADNQQAILQGLHTTLRAQDTLRLILVTHGHPDHVGAMPKLLQAYPDISVAYHENEQPFLSGKAKYADLTGDNIPFNLMKHFIPQAIVPKSRALSLKGQSGDVSDAFTSVLWLPKGILEYHAVPGHSPGQLAFFHKPTGSVMTGDAVVHTSAWFPFSAVKDICLKSPPGNFNTTLMKESQQTLAALPGAETFFPSHDANNGVSARALKQFVMA